MTALFPVDPAAASDLRDDWYDAQHLLDRQTSVLELIARDAPLGEVLDAVLRTLEEMVPDARTSVLLLDRATGTLHHGAAPSLPPAYVAAIDGLPVEDGIGACGSAAALNEPVVSADVLTDPRWAPFRDPAGAAGLRSCWSTPIDGRDGLPVGTFAVYRPHPHTPTAREQRLVDRLTHLAAVAIEHAALERESRARLEAETARRTAEELSHAKSQLLASVGHEARTPIQAIVGFAELLGTMDLDQARRREALDHIGAAAGHVMDLLNDVLDLSRLEAGALHLDVAPVPLREVVAEAFALLTTKAAARRAELSHDLGDEQVLADRRRLRQVLLNLVGNAVRHGRPDGRVRVSAEACPGGTVLLVRVADDGPGIPEELRPRLFTPFAHGAGAPAAAGGDPAYDESVGLGLGLAHGLVEAMGGALEVDRTSPAGTTMLLRLPLPTPDGRTAR